MLLYRDSSSVTGTVTPLVKTEVRRSCSEQRPRSHHKGATGSELARGDQHYGIHCRHAVSARALTALACAFRGQANSQPDPLNLAT